MKTELRHINGYKIEKLPFKLEKVGDLLYFDGPLMSVYSSTQKIPVIFDWVDSNNEFNRWLVYQLDTFKLFEYVNNKTTHFNLLNNPFGNVIFVVDKDINGEIQNCLVCSPGELPYEYLPKSHIEFDADDAVNLEEIKSRFNLHERPNKLKKTQFDILKEAKKTGNELINLHIEAKNEKVGHGRIHSSILGQVLTNYSGLISATAINLYDPQSRATEGKKVRRKKGQLRSIQSMAELDFVYAKAGSFSVFLRPFIQKYDLISNESSMETITKTVFSLFEASSNIEALKEINDSLNESMLSNYNSFLKDIKEKDISICVKYANPKSSNTLEEVFHPQKAKQILSNLETLEFENRDEVKTKGFFKALDSINNTFKFETHDGDIYLGTFSKQLVPGIFHFNLQDYYNVTIEILKTKKSGKKAISEKDILVSCIKIDD